VNDDVSKVFVYAAIGVILFVAVEVYTSDLDGAANKLLILRACTFLVGFLLAGLITNYITSSWFKKPPISPKVVSGVLVVGALFGLLMSGVSASTPQYSLTDSFSANLNNTNNQSIGFFIFSRQAHIPDTVSLSSFVTTSAEQFDRLIWENQSTTIHMNDPLGFEEFITPGAQYFFSRVGTYEYTSVNNPSLVGNIVVTAAEPLTVTMNGRVGEFTTTFSPQSFTLTSQEQIVNVSVNVPTDFPPGNYPFNVSFTTNAGPRNFTRQFTLPEIRRWEVVNNSVPPSFNVAGGDTQDLGTITVRNLGNVNFELDAVVTGSAQQYISSQSRVSMFRNTVSQFDFRVRVPTRQDDGVFNATIRVFGHGLEYSYPVNVTVRDLLPPVISNITYSSEFLMHENRVAVFVTDNVDVNATELFVDGARYAMTKDNNVFYATVVFEEPRVYEVVACSNDSVGNRACLNTTKQFQLLNIVNGSPSVDMLSKRFSIFNSKTLFTLSEKPPRGLTLRLDSFLPSFDTNNLSRPLIAEDGGLYSIRIVDGDGSYKYFTGTNSTVEVFEKGAIAIEIRSDIATLRDSTRSTYSGTISVANQPWRTPYSAVSFNGVVVNYTLPDSFKIQWGTGDGFLDCTVRDTGDLETSRGVCNLELSAQDLNRDLIVPVSLKEKQYLESMVADTKEEYERRLRNRNALAGVVLGLLGIVTLYSIFRVIVKPRVVYLKK